MHQCKFFFSSLAPT